MAMKSEKIYNDPVAAEAAEKVLRDKSQFIISDNLKDWIISKLKEYPKHIETIVTLSGQNRRYEIIAKINDDYAKSKRIKRDDRFLIKVEIVYQDGKYAVIYIKRVRYLERSKTPIDIIFFGTAITIDKVCLDEKDSEFKQAITSLIAAY